jgi:hypothetical protein
MLIGRRHGVRGVVQQRPTKRIELEAAPTNSRAGDIFFWITLLVWPLVALVVGFSVLPALDISYRDWPLFARLVVLVVILVVAYGPLAVSLLASSSIGRRVGRLRPLRWLLATTQPAARLDLDGIELCTPEAGCHRFRWDEIAGMAPTIAWRRGSFVEGWPTVDLTAPDGRVLLRVPESVYGRLKPNNWRSGPRTLAEHVVVTRPDRFMFLDTDLRPPFYWFGPAQTLANPEADHGD